RSHECLCPADDRPALAAQGAHRPPRQWSSTHRAARPEHARGEVSSPEADPAARQRRQAPQRAAAAAAPHPAASPPARCRTPRTAACQYVADWLLSLALSWRWDRRDTTALRGTAAARRPTG